MGNHEASFLNLIVSQWYTEGPDLFVIISNKDYISFMKVSLPSL